MFFFTIVIADRSDDLLVREVDRLRRVYRTVRSRHAPPKRRHLLGQRFSPV
jgi:hypothetical protein